MSPGRTCTRWRRRAGLGEIPLYTTILVAYSRSRIHPFAPQKFFFLPLAFCSSALSQNSLPCLVKARVPFEFILEIILGCGFELRVANVVKQDWAGE